MANNFNSSIQRNDLGQALIPDEISQEIIQTMPEKSVMLTRAKRMRMSAKKKTQPVLATLPEAYWVSEGGLKETTKSGWEDVNITAEELAVLVPIPDSVREDASINLFETMKPLIAEAFGKKIDQAACATACGIIVCRRSGSPRWPRIREACLTCHMICQPTWPVPKRSS